MSSRLTHQPCLLTMTRVLTRKSKFPSNQMSDPLTALMHAVQVMNLLKTLILKTLREREDDDAGAYSSFSSSSSLSDELEEEDGENDSGSENYNCSATERPKDIDKAAALRVDNEQLIGVSRRHTSTDCHLPYVRFSNDNEDVSLDDIEECFLRRLEWKSVRESVDEGDSRNSPPSEKEAEWLSSSENITEGSSTIGEERGRTSNATDVSINELRQTEIRTEMTSAEVRSAANGELILCS